MLHGRFFVAIPKDPSSENAFAPAVAPPALFFFVQIAMRYGM
jgi:hypothetical protein